MTPVKEIEHFLNLKRLAVVGVSRNSRDFTRKLWDEFKARRYDLVPVHPGVAEIDGRRSFANVVEIDPPVEGALLLNPASATDRVVADCAQAGIGAVWMYRATGAGALSENAVRFCKAKGIRVVAGECPFMFLPQSGWVHRIHGICRKVIGTYPQ